MSAPKKLYIKTYGCQMNVYDSERMVSAPGGQDNLPARIYNANQLNKPLILSGMETRSATLKIRPTARRF